MLTPAEAEKLVLENMAPLPREDCPLAAAHGRVLRADLRADRDLPPFDRVTLDGFALRAAALVGGRKVFRVAALQAAGMRAFKLPPEEDACIEIMTGAVVPEGADCIVPYEMVQRNGNMVTVNGSAAALAAGHAIHRRGSDHRAGEVVVRAGMRLTGREIAVAAACGHGVVTVTQVPHVAVVASGDELVEVESSVAAHQIRRSNDYALRAALIGAGFPRVSRFHLRDVQREIEHLLWHIIAEVDVVVITGGVSKGRFDFLPTELDRQGVRRIFQGVAQRPGKPLWFGVASRGTPVFALPGNPVSAYTCLHRYVLPGLRKASGLAPALLPPVALAAPVAGLANLAHLVPVKLRSGPNAERQGLPVAANTSGDFGALVGTDGFVELPPSATGFAAGTLAPFWSWV